ncbi:DUF2339 domain-containing protein [Nocardia mangyaensis]|uniref:DUF2339 domain-containing protein n=1 Tax=Nocardia mangyaensis TaxID=2213200 RepID=UPI002675958A|nr:DUF2339 domain-containing protein [Nocardia mangyaensis]MDO3649388.1 DUF2339 domain-containing protein [Nocardia mangyaensis]
MSTTIDPALVARLSGEFADLGTRMGRLGGDLDLLRTQLLADARERAESTAPPALRARSVEEQRAPFLRAGSVVGQGGAYAVESVGATRITREGQDQPQTVEASGPQHTQGASGEPVSQAAAVQGAPHSGWQSAPGGQGSVPGAGAPDIPGAAPGGWGPGQLGGLAGPQPGWGPPGVQGRPGYGGWPGAPYGPARPGGPRGPVGPGQRAGWVAPPVPPREPTTPWWQREGVISRVLAVAGVGVTLIGVLMLLVLAAQAGFFGPVARVVAGGALSLVLLGAGWRVFGKPGGRVGGIALVSTGIAGAYLDVVAMTGYYHWVPAEIGLALALVVALAGVGLAMRWQSQPLAVGVVVGAAVLSPALTTELMLLGFLVVLQAAGVPVQMRRDWPVLHVARTLPVVLAALSMIAVSGVAGAIGDAEATQRRGLLLAVIACAVVGLVGALLVVRRKPADITASVTIALTALPVLAVAMLFSRIVSASITGALAAVLLGLAATTLVPGLTDRLPRHTAAVAALTGAVAALQTCGSATGGHPHLLPTCLFVVALAFLAVAATSRARVAAALGLAFGLFGGLALLAIANPETLTVHRLAERHLDVWTAVAALIGLAVAAMAAWTVPRLPGWGDRTLVTVVWIAVSVAGLYCVLVTAVSLGVALNVPDGFVIGHSLATIVWMVAATASLFYGLRCLSRSPAVAKVCLVSGLLVAAAALAKLFLFDLATLSGLVRVIAFLAVGILLLLTGTRYARAFADSGTERTDAERTDAERTDAERTPS